MNYNDTFNDTFREFTEDLIRVFPEDPEFRMYQVGIETTIALYPSYVAEQFIQKVTIPYGDKILMKDQSFFLSHDYEEVTTEHKGASQVIEKIKHYWNNMGSENQEIVWKYFRVLILLSRKIST